MSHRPFFSESQQRSYSEGMASAIIDVLKVRGLTVTDERREKILACAELAELDRWVRKAVSVDTD